MDLPLFVPLCDGVFRNALGKTAYLPRDKAELLEAQVNELARIGVIRRDQGFVVFPNFGEKGQIRLIPCDIDFRWFSNPAHNFNPLAKPLQNRRRKTIERFSAIASE